MSVSKRKKVEYKNAFDTHVSLGFKKYADFSQVNNMDYDDKWSTFWYKMPQQSMGGCIDLHTSYDSLYKTFGVPIKVNGLEAYHGNTPMPFSLLRGDAVEFSNIYWFIFLNDRYVKRKAVSDFVVIANYGDNAQCQKKLEELSSSPDFEYRLNSYKDKLPQPFEVNKVSETMNWKIYHGQHWDNKSPYYRSSENVLDTIQYYLGENK